MTEHHDHHGLNPALAQTRYCPRCAAPEPRIDFPRSIVCDACGYSAFYNPKPVACAVAREPDGAIWLARRGFDPGQGRWSMPGGFVDLGESVEDALRRELREELMVEATIGAVVGVYSRAQDRVIVIALHARLHGTPSPTDEAPEVRTFAPDEVPWDELGFWSDAAALRAVLGLSAT